MKNIFKIFSFKKLKENIKEIYNRFPISMLIIFIIAGIFFVLLHYENNFSSIWERLIIANFSLIMTFILSIGVYLSSENLNKTKLQRNIIQIIPIIFWIIFYNIFSLNPNDFENFLFFILSFTWIIAYLFFAPYLKNLVYFKKDTETSSVWQVSQSVYYTYFYNISVVILISFIFAWLLFWLGAIGILATETLFDLNIKERLTYWNWAILSLSIITPLFALSQIPNKKSFLENHFNQNAFFSFLIKFVAIPFIYLYFFILYAYTIKVLLNFKEWPRWEVSWLVIWFSIFWYLSYIFSYIFEKSNKLIKNFRKIFPFAVIPQTFMLFYAIYLRINQYDITVNRYFVVVFWVWLLVISLYFIFSKKKNLIIIPSSLALFIILISIIPRYNVYNLPETRQLIRLKNNLEKANILQNSEIMPLKSYNDISEDLSKNIYSGISYLCDFSNCKTIKDLFPVIYNKIEQDSKNRWEKERQEKIEKLEKNKNKKICDYDKINFYRTTDINCYNERYLKQLKKEKYKPLRKWEIVRQITEKIKVKSYFSKYEESKKYFEFSKNYKQDIFPLKIKGYSQIYKIYNDINNGYRLNNYARYDIDKEEIIIIKNWEEYKKLSTKKITDLLFKKFWKDNFKNLDKKDLIFDLENSRYKLYFESISIKNPDYKESDDNIYIYSRYTNWYLLIKEDF